MGEKIGNHSGRRINRRSLIKAVGTSGAVTGFASTVQGESGTDPEEWEQASLYQVIKIYRSDTIATLRSELNGFYISTRNTKFATFEPDSVDALLFKIETRVGECLFYMTEDGEGIATLTLDTSSRHLPQSYREINESTHPVILSTGDRIGIRRQATDSEHQVVAERSGFDPENSVTVVDDLAGGYVITKDKENVLSMLANVENENETVEEKVIHIADDDVESLVTPNDLENNTSIQSIESNTISIQDEAGPGHEGGGTGGGGDSGGDDDSAPCRWKRCVGPCGGCVVNAVATCTACYIPCGGSLSGWGMIACALCLKGMCELGGMLVCHNCFSCLDQHVEGRGC